MRIRIASVLIFAFFAGTLVVGQAWGQVYQSTESPNAAGRLENGLSVALKYQNYIYGVVKKIGKDQMILDKTRFGNGQVFMLEKKTRYVDNGKRSTKTKFKVGDMVWIDAKIKKKTNEKIAKQVIKGVGPKTVSQ